MARTPRLAWARAPRPASAQSASGSASPPLLPAGQVVIPDGQTTANFTISLAGGIGSDASKTLAVELLSASGLQLLGPFASTQIVNNHPVEGVPAVPDFQQVSGPGILIHNGNSWTLDLGAVQQGQHLDPLQFAAANDGPFPGADFLSGSLEAAGTGFTTTLGSPFSGLSAHAIINEVEVDVDTSTLGTFTETITLHPSESNITGFSGALPDQVLTITERWFRRRRSG